MSELRLDSLKVENFRSISGSWLFPLDAQVTLVHGPNGAGKTSLLSAIELAATGRVAFLDGHAQGQRDVLLNRRYPLGSVELRLRGPDGSTRLGAIELGGARPRGRAALDEDEQNLFLERCFLPQTALGRLLETYTKSSRDVDTALVRFVKSVVGLDELDGVIEGLHAAGHVARTRAVSARWENAEQQAAQLAARRRQIETELKHAETELADEISNLRALAGEWASESTDSDLPSHVVASLRAEESTPDQLSHLERLRVRLAGVSTAYEDGFGETPPDGREDQAGVATQSASAYAKWERSDGAAALEGLNRIRQRALSLAPVGAAQMFTAFGETREKLDHELRQRVVALQNFSDAEERRSLIQQELAGTLSRLDHATSVRASLVLPADVRTLIDIIQLTLPLVDSDVCPVCDSPFTATHQDLRSHLSDKLDSLSRDARESLELDDTVRGLESRASQLRDELDKIVIGPKPADQASLDPFVRDMNALETPIREGQRLLAALERFEGRSAELAAQRAALELAKRMLAEIRGDLGLPESDLGVVDEMQFLRRVLEDRIQNVEYLETRRARMAAAADVVDRTRREVEDLRDELAVVRTQIRSYEHSLGEATKRKDAANSLRKEAERIRSSVINDVFDARLNTLWADLFARFVPTEPFVPRFKKQTNAMRAIDIALETELPDGSKSGEPSSVLSYGNTNTAALSLFIALHLSAPRQLPWLVLDDPVQSMDDIHVANFATIMRQLAFSHRRQVVIAVHQRELFDYLALELSPAASDETLVKIALDRFADTTSVEVERVHYVAEESLAQVL